MRLGVRFVGAARGAEEWFQTGGIERAVEAAPALAGGDAKGSFTMQPFNERAHAGKEPHRLLARAKMVAVTLDEFGDVLGPQSGHREAQRVVQAEADDVARLLLRRHLQPEIAGREADAFRDGARRVDDGPVPVEYQQGITMPACQSALLTRSARRRTDAGMAAPIAFAVF